MMGAIPKINPGRRGLDEASARQIYNDYLRLKSLRGAALLHGRTNQALHEMFQRRGWPLVARRLAPVIEYNGRRFTPGKDGYLRDTSCRKKSNGTFEVQLNRQVWVDHHGPIPAGHEVIFLDGDKSNCAISNLKCLPRPEARSAQSSGENGHTKARQTKRIQENMGYIVREASKRAMRHPTIEFEDLVQQGRLAIVRADKSFDASKGYKFLTYACHWIRQSMDRWIMDHAKVVRLPTNQWKADGVRTFEVHIEAPIDGDADGRTLLDLLPVEETCTDEADASDRVELVQRALSELKPILASTMRKRFFENKTHQEIADEEGVTHQAIWLREQAALKQLRKKAEFLRRVAA
jgi:RNA polymerase sigma factor (sigma-70 family)